MDFALLQAIAALDPTTLFRLANDVPPSSEYIFDAILPNEQRNDYNASSASMLIRTTMAGLVGMDSPYPPGGAVSQNAFNERVPKIAIDVPLNEQTLRELQSTLNRLRLTGGNTTLTAVNVLTNFMRKIVLQSIVDTQQWMKGRALVDGLLNWTFGNITLSVDYQVPAANFLPARTIASGTAYHLPGSKFWEDMRLLEDKFNGQLRALIVHPKTASAIINNPANELRVLSRTRGRVQTIVLQRIIQAIGGTGIAYPTGVPSQDSRDNVTLIAYGHEAEIINPAEPGTTIKVPFMKQGKVLAIGENVASQQVVGVGTTQRPEGALGYGHVAPTQEAGGAPGTFSRLFVPQEAPWMVRGQAAANFLPVLEEPSRVATATTEMPA